MDLLFRMLVRAYIGSSWLSLIVVFYSSAVCAHNGHHHNRKYSGEKEFFTKEEANTFLERDKRQLSRCSTDEPFCEENIPFCSQESDREYFCVAFGTQCAAGQRCYLSVPCPVHWETGCTDIDECESNPCQNGATCTNGDNMYTCTCVPGYTGTNCEIDINECESNPCLNGATCNDLINQYTCTCDEDFTGYHCETDMCLPHFPEGVDIAFVMDASKSHCRDSFTKQKEYIKDFILDFPIGPNDTQISVVSFTLNVDVHFYLNKHSSHDDMVNIIDNINCSSGPSFIESAFSKLGDEVFQVSNGARSGVSKYVIVLTDGLFSNLQDAATQASLLKNSFPEIQMFAVGTGEQVLHTELMSIASHFSKVFPITNRDVVNSIVKSRVMSGCPDCFQRTSDIAIVMDASVTLTKQQFYTQLDAMRTLLKVIPVSYPGIHVSYIRFGGDVQSEFNFNEYQSTHAVISATSVPSRLTQLNGESNVSKALEHMRINGFGTAQNARSDARKIVLLFTPALNVNVSDKNEAGLLKDEGVMLVTIGTGRDSNLTNLLALASDPSLVYVVGDDVNIAMASLYSLIGSLEHDVCELD